MAKLGLAEDCSCFTECIIMILSQSFHQREKKRSSGFNVLRTGWAIQRVWKDLGWCGPNLEPGENWEKQLSDLTFGVGKELDHEETGRSFQTVKACQGLKSIQQTDPPMRDKKRRHRSKQNIDSPSPPLLANSRFPLRLAQQSLPSSWWVPCPRKASDL